jgi:hypothetical protein
LVRVSAVFAVLAAIFLNRTLLPEPGHALGSHDMRALFVPWLELTRTALWQGRLPFWHAAQFSGYPFLANPQVALFYPPTWVALLLPVRLGISVWGWLHLVLAGTGMYALTRVLHGRGAGPWLAGLTFAFSGYSAVRLWAGHIGLLATATWLPWLLLLTWWAFRRRSAWAGVLTGVPLGLAILAGHTTSLIYVGLVWGCFGLYAWAGGWSAEKQVESMGVRGVRIGRIFLLALLTGLLLSSVQLLPLLQFSRLSSRAAEATFEFASAYSFPPTHLITLLVPIFFGEPLRIGYWSVPNFEELTWYIGVLPLLALAIAWRKPDRHTLFYTALTVAGVLLALGSYGFLYRLAWEWLPPFRLARVPARALLFVAMALPLLLGQLANRPPDMAVGRWIRHLAAIIAVSGAAAVAATGALFFAIHPTDTSGRLWHQLGGWLMALVVLLAGAGVWWWYNRPNLPPRRRKQAAFLLALLIVIDLWSFGIPFIRTSPVQPDPFWHAAASLVQEGTEARVLPWGVDIFSQNGAWQAGLHSIFGYNALEVGTHVALAASVPDPRSTAYDILGAGYVISPWPLEQYGDGERPLTLIGEASGGWLYQRARVLPLARTVSQAEIIPDDGAAIARIHAADFDPVTTVILEDAPPCVLTGEGTAGSAEIVARHDGFWHIRTRTTGPALLVLSETAYPGWEVWVNGERHPWQRAYTAVRAVCLPVGESEVVWRYRPIIFAWGGLLSVVGLGVVAVAWRRTDQSVMDN